MAARHAPLRPLWSASPEADGDDARREDLVACAADICAQETQAMCGARRTASAAGPTQLMSISHQD
jgi:hypothetical protein